MRIKNKKYFIIGILFILLGIAIALVRFFIFTEAVHGRLRTIITAGVFLFIGICHVVLAYKSNDDNKKED